MRTLPESKNVPGGRRGRSPRAASIFKPRPSRRIERFSGRLLALAIFLVALPFMAVIALAIWAFDRHTPLFWQERIGKAGRPFRMVKLRSMRPDADPYMPKPPESDPIITPIGRLIRRRAIDEGAQLWNVARGKMALVGPRPEMKFIVDDYDEVEKVRLAVCPGLTGLWQLSRVRDRAIHHHIEYDLFYVYNRSLGMDLWLLWRTLLFALFGTGTKIRLAVQRWERDTGWRALIPDRSRAIPRRTRPLLSRVWAVAGTAIFILVIVPGVAAGLGVRGDLTEAKTSLLEARSATRELLQAGAIHALDDAERALRRAEGRLNSPFVFGARAIPGVRQNFDAVEALSDAGLDVVEAGRAGLKAMQTLRVAEGGLQTVVKDGTVDLAPMLAAAPHAQRISRKVDSALRTVSSEDSPLLIPQVRSAREEMISILQTAQHEADVAAAASSLIPRILGADGSRTWVIGAENIAEARGRGGYLGSLATLTADGGTLSLSEFSPTTELPELPQGIDGMPPEYAAHYRRIGGLFAWQNLTMSPHFPSGAQVMLKRLEQAGVVKADGVISLDPVALSYLLEVTGPVELDGLPEPLTQSNMVEWALNRHYFYFASDNTERREQLAEVGDAVWTRLLSGEGIDPKAFAEALGRGLSERRVVIYSYDPGEQALIERLGIGGGLSDEEGDYLLLVGQNLGENKMDYYLDRSMTYSGEIDAAGTLRADLKIDIENTAPQGVEFPGHVGSPRPHLGLEAGFARSYLEVFVPRRAVLQQVRIDGKPSKNFEVRDELGKSVYITTVTLGPGQSQRIEFSYVVRDAVVDGVYRLNLQNQAMIRPDQLAIDVAIPEGIEIGARDGFGHGPRLSWEGELVSDTELSAELDVPWHVRLASKVSSWLNKPAIEIGKR